MTTVATWRRAIAGSAACFLVFWACDPPEPDRPGPSLTMRSTKTKRTDPRRPAPPHAPSNRVGDAAPDAEPRLAVYLVPIGNVPDETLVLTSEALREHAPVNPVVVRRHGFPARARSPRAGAFEARVLLDWLNTLSIPKTGKIMGVTDADIVTRKGKHPIWGILGMGSIDGRCSVISTYRMRRTWENGGAPAGLVRERLWKVAIHELGHTLGLDHCPRIGCIMEDGHGTVKTIDRDTKLCEACSVSFADSLRTSALR